MSRSTSACNQQNSTRTLPHQQHVLVVKRHHLLVRWSHWLNVPILLGLLLSGISIYWASPVYQHKPDPTTGNFDVRPRARTAPLQQSTRLDLQPRKSWTGNVSVGSASALVVRVLLHAEWHSLRRRLSLGRRLAVVAAS